jgi:hypothetical protein
MDICFFFFSFFFFSFFFLFLLELKEGRKVELVALKIEISWILHLFLSFCLIGH